MFPMYWTSIFLIRSSIVLQYLQLFVPFKKPRSMYVACYLLILVNFVFYLISIFLEMFQCSPVRALWDPFVSKAHCINVLAISVTVSTINSASDLVILLLSQISIWRLQMSLRRKFQISGVFLVGILYVSAPD